jgi:hypothetical protein
MAKVSPPKKGNEMSARDAELKFKQSLVKLTCSGCCRTKALLQHTVNALTMQEADCNINLRSESKSSASTWRVSPNTWQRGHQRRKKLTSCHVTGSRMLLANRTWIDRGRHDP